MKRLESVVLLGLISLTFLNGSYGLECPFAKKQKRNVQLILLTPATSPARPNPFVQYQNSIASSRFYQCPAVPNNCSSRVENYYYRSYDGSCNNLKNPSYGQAGTRYSRLLPPHAPPKDIVDPRKISIEAFGDQRIEDGIFTLLNVHFGMFLGHDISAFKRNFPPTACCTSKEANNPLCIQYAVNPRDIIYEGGKHKCNYIERGATDNGVACNGQRPTHPEKVNLATAFLDASPLYGTNKAAALELRALRGGLLKSSFINGNEMLAMTNNRTFIVADDRELLSAHGAAFHSMLVAYHNTVARKLAAQNPNWSDEKLFQVARTIVTGVYQFHVYEEWLPIVLGSKEAAAINQFSPVDGFTNDYDDRLNPATFAESSQVALRYFHTHIFGLIPMITPDFKELGKVRFSDTIGVEKAVPYLTTGQNFPSFIRSILVHSQKASDHNIDAEIKHFFERQPGDIYGHDLRVIDFKRARDFEVATYNSMRKECGFKQAVRFEDFTDFIPKRYIPYLKSIYPTPDDLELCVSGALESVPRGKIVGPTFACVISKQFYHLRRADRFSYNNRNNVAAFSRAQLAEIRRNSLASVICEAVKSIQVIQPDVWRLPSSQNRLTDCKRFHKLDVSAWKNA